MSRDHYIAQTYLKHFIGNDGFIHACRKSDGKTFPCRPDAICHEWEGDIIPDFLQQPGYLGEYRKLFEPNWSNAVAEIMAMRCPDDVKLAIAGYWANLMVCTPTWKRIGVSIYNWQTLDFLRSHRDLSDNQGKPDQIIANALEAIDAGLVKFNVDPNYIRAVSASQVMEHGIKLYNADWIIVSNDTDVDFLTSDNPAAMEDPGPFRCGSGGLWRYLPVTPRLCLICEPMARAVMEGKFELPAPSKGRVRFATTTKRRIVDINRAIVQNAENLVLSSKKLTSVEELTKEYAKYRVVSDFLKLKRSDGHIFIAHTRVKEVP